MNCAWKALLFKAAACALVWTLDATTHPNSGAYAQQHQNHYPMQALDRRTSDFHRPHHGAALQAQQQNNHRRTEHFVATSLLIGGATWGSYAPFAGALNRAASPIIRRLSWIAPLGLVSGYTALRAFHSHKLAAFPPPADPTASSLLQQPSPTDVTPNTLYHTTSKNDGHRTPATSRYTEVRKGYKRFPELLALPLREETDDRQKLQSVRRRGYLFFLYDGTKLNYKENELTDFLVSYDELSPQELQIFAGNLMRWKKKKTIKVRRTWNRDLFENFMRTQINSIHELHLLLGTGLGINWRAKNIQRFARQQGVSEETWIKQRHSVLARWDAFHKPQNTPSMHTKLRLPSSASTESLELLWGLLPDSEILYRASQMISPVPRLLPELSKHHSSQPHNWLQGVSASQVKSFVASLSRAEEKRIFLGRMLKLQDESTHLPAISPRAQSGDSQALPDQHTAELAQRFLRHISHSHHAPSTREDQAQFSRYILQLWENTDQKSLTAQISAISNLNQKVFTTQEASRLSREQVEVFLKKLDDFQKNIFLTLVLKITPMTILQLSESYLKLDLNLDVSPLDLAHMRNALRQRFIDFARSKEALIPPSNHAATSPHKTPTTGTLTLSHDQQQQEFIRRIQALNASFQNDYYQLSKEEFRRRISRYLPSWLLNDIDRTQLLWNIAHAHADDRAPHHYLFVFFTQIMKTSHYLALSQTKNVDEFVGLDPPHTSRYRKAILDYFASFHLVTPAYFFPAKKTTKAPLKPTSIIISPTHYPHSLLSRVRQLQQKLAKMPRQHFENTLKPWTNHKELAQISPEKLVELISHRFDDLHVYVLLTRFLGLTSENQPQIAQLFSENFLNFSIAKSNVSRAEIRLRKFLGKLRYSDTLHFDDIEQFVEHLEDQYHRLIQTEKLNIALKYHIAEDHLDAFYSYVDSFLQQYRDGSPQRAIIYHLLLMKKGPWIRTQIAQMYGASTHAMNKMQQDLLHRFLLHIIPVPKFFNTPQEFKTYQKETLNHVHQEEGALLHLHHKLPLSMHNTTLKHKLRHFYISLSESSASKSKRAVRTDKLLRVFLSQVFGIPTVDPQHLRSLLSFRNDAALKRATDMVRELWSQREVRTYSAPSDYETILSKWQSLSDEQLRTLYKPHQDFLQTDQQIPVDDFHLMVQEFFHHHLPHNEARHIFLLGVLKLEQPTYRRQLQLLEQYGGDKKTLAIHKNMWHRRFGEFLREKAGKKPPAEDLPKLTFSHKEDMRDFFWSKLQEKLCSSEKLPPSQKVHYQRIAAFVAQHIDNTKHFNLFFSRILRWYPLSTEDFIRLHRTGGEGAHLAYTLKTERSLRSLYESFLFKQEHQEISCMDLLDPS